MNKSVDYQHLLKNQAFIGGRWISAGDEKVFEVRNPFDGEIIECVPNMGVTDTRSAIQEAAKAFKQWSLTTASQRSRILRKWFDLQLQHKEALAVLLTLEQGKPLIEAKGEIIFGAGFVEWFAEEAKRAYGDVIPTHSRDKRVVTIKQPIGVVAAITPWNFPNAMITRKVAPALAAGCTVVIKPAEDTPLSALALAVLAEEAGFPPGVINVITTNQPEEVGLELS
ncbi:MAG: aldehyde dehydrogenase family protein, partial [Cyclobacteriaceae bacterium]|nr:aldehyde dehydrogenase family protein [Cyclobacteriaceae bacterium]